MTRGCALVEGYLVYSPWHRKLWDEEVRSSGGRMAMANGSMGVGSTFHLQWGSNVNSTLAPFVPHRALW